MNFGRALRSIVLSLPVTIKVTHAYEKLYNEAISYEDQDIFAIFILPASTMNEMTKKRKFSMDINP